MATVMESAADHYRHLGATSLCSGFAVECLLSLEKYRATKKPSALRSTIPECQGFIQNTLAALKEEGNAPYSIRRAYRELLAKKKVDKKRFMEGWKNVGEVISKIQKGERPKEEYVVSSIKFLIKTVSGFNDVNERLEKKLYASSWFTRELI